jgi:ketosteroid isomerase-like protein
MTLTLPPPIAAYFAADRSGDVDALLAAFAQDGVVIDERQSHVGHAAIRAWKAGASAQYNYTAEPVALTGDDRDARVTAQVSGDFPGSPVCLHYAFTLDGGRIARLEITP